jgi:hypothetical protein
MSSHFPVKSVIGPFKVNQERDAHVEVGKFVPFHGIKAAIVKCTL